LLLYSVVIERKIWILLYEEILFGDKLMLIRALFELFVLFIFVSPYLKNIWDVMGISLLLILLPLFMLSFQKEKG